MRGTDRAARAAVVVLAGAFGVAGSSIIAGAQIRNQGAARAPQAPPQHRVAPTFPGPGASRAPRIAYAAEPRHQGQYHQYRQQSRYLPQVIYVAVPSYGYGYGYAPSGCGASVCDVNGHPVMRGFDDPTESQPLSPATVPDISGSPYVALDGGVIFVDFGNGDRRNVPACAQQAAASTPDGQPRTVFYTPQADGLILRAGSRGRVIGTPPAGAATCYDLDQYGRVALAY